MIRNDLLVRLWVVAFVLPALPLITGCGGSGPDDLMPAGEARQRHKSAAERIERLGGRVELGGGGSSVRFFQVDPGAIEDALPLIRRLLKPESVTIVPAGGRRAAASVGLAAMGDLPELQHVLIRGMQLSASDLQYLSDRPNLRELHLIDTDLTDRQLSEIATGMQLRRLTLVDQPITDKGIVNLRRMRSLLRLRLVGTRVSVQAAEKLTDAIPRLLVELDGRTIRGEYAPE